MLGARTIGPRFLGAGRAVLAPAIPISGSGSASATGTGAVGRASDAFGTGTAVSTGTGAVLRRRGLLGTATATATGQGAPGAILVVAGAGEGQAQGQGALGSTRPVSGSGAAKGLGSSTIGRTKDIAGAGDAFGIGSARLGARRLVSGAGDAEGLGDGTPAISRFIAGTGSAVATGFGSFLTPFTGTFASGRIIFIPPRDPNLLIPARNPIIRIRVDDEGIIVLQSKEKQPSEVVDYVLDMREWFKKVDPADYIDQAASTIAITPTGDPEDLVAGPADPTSKPALESADGLEPKLVRIWLGRGRDGIEYKVTIKIQTNKGRVEEADLPVFVQDT